MGRTKKRLRALTVTLASGLVALSGCLTPDASKSQVQVQKPDVTQPGVLPPPQAMMAGETSTASTGSVVPAGGTQPAAANPAAPVASTPPAQTQMGQRLAKLTHPDKKVPASELAVAWRNHIEKLPDPSRNGVMGSGLAGQMFLFGGPKLQFIEADGVLTIDLVDVTPRPPGQKAAIPERWQFNKEMLRRLKANDETFGKSYVLFLPWPDYRPDITRVRITARYDPENGHTLFATPSIVSLSSNGPVWDGTLTSSRMDDQPAFRMGNNPAQFGGSLPMGGMMPGTPQPLGASLPPQFPAMPQMPLPQPQPLPQMMPPIPLSPGGPVGPPPSAMPLAPGNVPGTMPLAPVAPEGLEPIGFTINR